MVDRSGRTEAEALRTAFHECGHATAAYVLRGRVGTVSIRPRRGWAGVACARAPSWHADDLARTDLGAPLVVWPARARRALEGPRC
jgi:ATP-dependent Zn protease